MTRSFSLSICFGLLVVLVAVSPVLAITGSWIGPQLVTLTVAVMLIGFTAAPRTDVERSFAIYRALAMAAAFPAVWMLLQLVPVPLGSIDHPVWRSATTALGQNLLGHISVDLGYTFRSLMGYSTLLALAFMTSVVTRDRERAEILLFALCAATNFIALELIVFRGSVVLKLNDAAIGFTSSLIAITTFGAILNAAFIERALERHETRKEKLPLWKAVRLILTGAAGAVVCFVALIMAASADVIVALLFGLSVFVLVVVLRRLRLGRWTAVTLCAAVLIASVSVVVLRFASEHRPVGAFLRFTTVGSADAATATMRMIADANWLGGGVGTYSALAALYRNIDGIPGQTALNTATSIILEWGWAGFFVLILLIVQLVVLLFRAAWSRGRDSFYSATAAACLVIVFCEAFCDASFLGPTVQMLTAVILALGLSQTSGRRFS